MKMYMFFRIYESNRKKKKDKNDNPTSKWDTSKSTQIAHYIILRNRQNDQNLLKTELLDLTS